MADNSNTLNYDASTVNSLLNIVDTNKGVFPLDAELSATSEHAVKNSAIYAAIKNLESNNPVKNKGFYKDLEALKTAHSTSDVGDIAYVGATPPYKIYTWGGNGWEDTGNTYTPEIDLNDYPTKEEMESIKTATEAAAEKAEQMASYTEAASVAAVKANNAANEASEAAEKANEAAKKAEGLSAIKVMTYQANVSETAASGTSEVAAYVDIPNVPSLPKLLVLTAKIKLGTAPQKTVTVACHYDSDTGYIVGASNFTLSYNVNVATNDYYENTLNLFVTVEKASNATATINITDVTIFY